MSHVRSKVRRLSALCTVSALAFTASNVALAQTMPNAQVDGRATNFNIPAQPLGEALADYAEQADVLILASADVTRGKRSAGISGLMTASAALDALLNGQGLKGDRRADGSILVNEQGGDSEQKNLNPAPVLMAQNTSQTPSMETSSRSSEGGTSIVTGKVIDARTGANLRGALVTVEESGQWTSTNDLGEFRIVGIPKGNMTLTVSYLGYTRQSALIGVRGDAVSQSFALRGANEIEEILVIGQRSARALSLNQERTAENSVTVLSSDVLGQFPGATLAESLRRAPGIAFQEDPLTGEGTNVIVRGLAPELNQIRLDGQRLAEGSGVGRTPAIGNLLTDSIDEVTISKTLLPSQDTNGAGGLIEITTKGPLDRPARFANISAETEWNDGFQSANQFSASASGIFGREERFGLSANVQYRETTDTTVGYGNQLEFGQYLPNDANGNPVRSRFQLDPMLSFPFENGADEVYPRNLLNRFYSVDTETLAGTLSAQWQPFAGTDLRLSYTRTQQDFDTSERRLGLSVAFGGYVPLPIDQLSGEVRGALVWEDAFADFGFPGLAVTASQGINADRREELTDVLSFQGTTDSGPWTFNYRLSRSAAENSSRLRQFSYRTEGGSEGFFTEIPETFVSNAARQNTIDGRLVSLFDVRRPGDSGYRLPLLSQAGFDYFNDPSNYVVLPRDDISEPTSEGENTRNSAAFSVRREFGDSLLSYLEAGIEYESSRFDTFAPDQVIYEPIRSLTLDELGITDFRGDNLSAVGIDGGLLTATERDLANLFSRLEALSSGNNPLFARNVFSTAGFSNEGTFTDEEELAGYLQARVEWADFELIGGFRFSEVEVSANVWATDLIVNPDGSIDPDFGFDNRRLVAGSASQTDVLPRLIINYRPTERLVFRGGYYQSTSRPTIQDISGGSRAILQLDLRPIFGPTNDRPRLSVREGNPNLRPAVTHSFDLSSALYSDDGGVVQISIFYKNIEDFLEFTSNATSEVPTDLELPDDPRFQNLPEDVVFETNRPTNNDEPAEIWGIELNVEQQFVDLPGAWAGLGFYGNYTYTDSEKFFVFNNVVDPTTGEFTDVEVSGVPFDQSPEHSGTVALTYNQYGWDASLAYTAQSKRLRVFNRQDLSFYNDSDDTLDLRVEYRFDKLGDDFRVFFAGTDLLKGEDDPDTLTYIGGSRKYYNNATFFGGRVFSAGISASF